ADTGVVLHPSLQQAPSFDWALARPTLVSFAFPADARYRVMVVDRRFVPLEKLRTLTAGRAVTGVGPFLVIDRDAPAAPAEGYAFRRTEPTRGQRLVLGAHDPIFDIVPDRLATWELRELLAQTPNPAPVDEEPTTLTAAITAYDAALAQADGVTAA